MIFCILSLSPPSHSSQHKPNKAVSLPTHPALLSPSLNAPPFPAASLPFGNTLSHLLIPSNLNPSLLAQSREAVLRWLVCHWTRRSPRPGSGEEGSENACWRSRPHAFEVMCVRWKEGRIVKQPISVDRFKGELMRYPITPANVFSISPSAFLSDRVLSKIANRTAVGSSRMRG